MASRFLDTIRTELQPIAVHGVVATAIVLFVFIMALIGNSIKNLAPANAHELFDTLESIERWTITINMTMFSSCTTIRLAIRLIRGIGDELRGTRRDGDRDA